MLFLQRLVLVELFFRPRWTLAFCFVLACHGQHTAAWGSLPSKLTSSPRLQSLPIAIRIVSVYGSLIAPVFADLHTFGGATALCSTCLAASPASVTAPGVARDVIADKSKNSLAAQENGSSSRHVAATTDEHIILPILTPRASATSPLRQLEVLTCREASHGSRTAILPPPWLMLIAAQNQELTIPAQRWWIPLKLLKGAQTRKSRILFAPSRSQELLRITSILSPTSTPSPIERADMRSQGQRTLTQTQPVFLCHRPLILCRDHEHPRSTA